MIALSARTDPADVEAGRDAGFTDYVAKFQREALIASLRNAWPNRSRRSSILQGRTQMATDVLETVPTPATDEEERVFVTLTVADQLCGVPVLGVRDILGEHAITRIPLAPAEIAGSLNLRGRIVTAIDLRRRLHLPPPPAGQPRMSVVAEQGGELYALLVDQVSEVMSLKASAFERNPPTLPPSGHSSAVASIGWTAGCWWCSTWASCSRSAKPSEARRHGAYLPCGR